MVRDPWTFVAALIVFGIIGWLLVAERPQKRALRLETFQSFSVEPDLRLISERSPYLRTER
jgi:hypothetical protein